MVSQKLDEFKKGTDMHSKENFKVLKTRLINALRNCLNEGIILSKKSFLHDDSNSFEINKTNLTHLLQNLDKINHIQ